MQHEEVTAELLAYGRVTHFNPHVDDRPTYSNGYGYSDRERKMPVTAPEQGANIVSSLLTNGMHAPAIDLDVPARLVPSSTPGHGHLYIAHEMSWRDYRALLFTMAKVGLVEEGFYQSSLRRRATHLRLPGVAKGVLAGR